MYKINNKLVSCDSEDISLNVSGTGGGGDDLWCHNYRNNTEIYVYDIVHAILAEEIG